MISVFVLPCRPALTSRRWGCGCPFTTTSTNAPCGFSLTASLGTATTSFLRATRNSQNDVVAIPNEAVNESPQGAFVEVVVNGQPQPQRREVKVGLQGNTKTEIIDGLQLGEVVVTGRIFNRQDEGPGSPFGRPFGPRMGGSSPRGGAQGGPGGGGQGGPPGGGGR